jgi:hypothetical protein
MIQQVPRERGISAGASISDKALLARQQHHLPGSVRRRDPDGITIRPESNVKNRAVSTPAMAARKLGGGRILGSGKSLAPPNTSSHTRSSSLLSVGESVVSVDSNVSTPLGTSPLKDSGNDLGSRVSLDSRNDGNAANTGSTKLICPICNEEMVRSQAPGSRHPTNVPDR